MSRSFSTAPHRFDRTRLLLGLIAPLVALLVLAAACGDDEVADDPAPTTQAPPEDTTTTRPPAETTTTEVASDDVPECDQEAISTLLVGHLGSDGVEIDRVEITDCDGGFARALVFPVADNFETEQVFLRSSGAGWEIIDFGTGIECGDGALSEELVEACDALGLS